METPNLAALRRAIEICGSQRALAAELQISKVAVGQWLLDTDNENHRDVPPRQCVRIEQITGGQVGRRELRPHDWREWWPDEVGAPVYTQGVRALSATETVAGVVHA